MSVWLAAQLRNRVVLAATVGVVALIVGGTVFTVVALNSRSSTASAPAASPTGMATATATASPTSTAIASPTAILHAGILDGVPMTDAEWQARKDLLPIAVMLDNSADAYPQTGLDKADLVYEAFVEGGITRFMAVYWRQGASFIEPVRSARTPFVIWVSELDALYAHAGEADTSNAADSGGQIQSWGIKDLTAFGGVATSAYYRDPSRYAPHNLVTSTAALRAAADRAGYKGPPTVAPWFFRNPGDPPPVGKPAGGIEVDFEGNRSFSQLVQWKWDAATNSYLRFEFGGPHIDGQTKQQLHFTNVVVMTVPSQVVDSSGHVLLDQIGSGPATVFFDGQAIAGTWKKADRTARTRFYDAQGNEIAFERGNTFIEVIGLQSSFLVTATAEALQPMPEYIPPPPSTAPPPATETLTPAAIATANASATLSPTASPSPGATSTGTASPGASPTAGGSASPATTPATSTPAPASTTATVPAASRTAVPPSSPGP